MSADIKAHNSTCNESFVSVVFTHPAYMPGVFCHLLIGIVAISANPIAFYVTYRVEVFCANIRILLLYSFVAAFGYGCALFVKSLLHVCAGFGLIDLCFHAVR